MTPNIQKPTGKVIISAGGKAELKFNSNFVPKWTKRYIKAQKVVDSEVLRLSDKYTPLLTGTLRKTGILGTEVGSGTVSWIAPYARFQYYRGRRPGTKVGEPLQGRYWFERMKAVHKGEIVAAAQHAVDGKEKPPT